MPLSAQGDNSLMLSVCGTNWHQNDVNAFSSYLTASTLTLNHLFLYTLLYTQLELKKETKLDHKVPMEVVSEALHNRNSQLAVKSCHV